MAAYIAHDTKPGGPEQKHDSVATVLIVGASSGIGLETVKAALKAKLLAITSLIPRADLTTSERAGR